MKPNGHRYQFRLRTVLIVMSVCCAWLAWEQRIVVNRRIVLADAIAHGAEIRMRARDTEILLAATGRSGLPHISWIRRMMGDQEVLSIRWSYCHASVAERIRSAFPEAELSFPDIEDDDYHPDRL